MESDRYRDPNGLTQSTMGRATGPFLLYERTCGIFHLHVLYYAVSPLANWARSGEYNPKRSK